MGLDKQHRSTRTFSTGKNNLITDVPGVKVGHVTLSDGGIQTGVTAILPHDGNMFTDKYLAASTVINGFGKSVGLIQVDEMGTIETPIILTNTLSVGTASTALVKHMLDQNEDIGVKTGTVNPIVLECNDMQLNDIRGMHVRETHIAQAIKDADIVFSEGAVGAGRGMMCHELKGGIGSASRLVKINEVEYTVGVLVMSNHGSFEDLMIDDKKLSNDFELPNEKTEEKGSIIVVIATDAPLSERQLKRVSNRAVVGLSRTGAYIGNGSGELALAFSTATKIPHQSPKEPLSMNFLHDDDINPLFKATAEAVHESVVSSMTHAESVSGIRNKTVVSLNDLTKKTL